MTFLYFHTVSFMYFFSCHNPHTVGAHVFFTLMINVMVAYLFMKLYVCEQICRLLKSSLTSVFL